jgi:hypothetical protein
MPQNDFLPFSTGAGANVVTQSNYANDPVTAAGFSSGIAPSAKFNKVWRQSSFVSSALAQLVCDQLGIDILDDGNMAEFKANLRAALLGLNPRQVAPIGGTQFWVNVATGSDANTGISPSVPWKTLQQAANYVAENVDANLQKIIVNIADGTYPGFTLNSPVLGLSDPSNLVFLGNTASPQNVVIQSPAGGGVTACVSAQNGAMFLIQGVRFSSTGTGIWINNFGRVRYGFCDFAACAGDHVYCEFHSHARMLNNCTVSGSANNHIHLRAAATFITAGPLTLNMIGTPHWGSQFLGAGGNSYVDFNDQDSPLAGSGSLVFSGPSTGRRFWVHGGAVVHTNVGDAATPNYLPGDAPGLIDTATYGVYNSGGGGEG